MTNAELMTGLGAAASVFLASTGAVFGSIPAGVFALKSSGFVSMCPIIISGVLAIYGCIVAVLLSRKFQDSGTMTEADGYKNFSAGLAVGFACLVSGLGMARFLESFMKAHPRRISSFSPPEDEQQARPLLSSTQHEQGLCYSPIKFLMIFCFIEAIGLYGLIVALLLMQ